MDIFDIFPMQLGRDYRQSRDCWVKCIMSWPIENIGPDFRHWSMHDLLGNKLFCLPSAILPCTSSALSIQSSQFFWWAIFRVNSMKWKNIPPIFFLLTSLCFASWRTRKPQLFLRNGFFRTDESSDSAVLTGRTSETRSHRVSHPDWGFPD